MILYMISRDVYKRQALDALEIPYDTDATQSQEPLASSLEETAASQPGDGSEGDENPNRAWIDVYKRQILESPSTGGLQPG